MNLAAAIQVRRGDGRLPVVLTCEHAGQVIPPEYDNLGLTPAQIEACPDSYDRGAAEIFEKLVATLHCDGARNDVCRLLIDVNRYPQQYTLIPRRCAGLEIPGNRNIGARERLHRTKAYYRPWQRQVVSLLHECEQRHGIAYLFAIHTMAEDHCGKARPMDFSLVCNRGCRVAAGLSHSLRAAGCDVRTNEPFRLYDDVLRVPGDSPAARFNARAVLIETNTKHRGQAWVPELLAAAIRDVVGNRCLQDIDPRRPDRGVS